MAKVMNGSSNRKRKRVCRTSSRRNTKTRRSAAQSIAMESNLKSESTIIEKVPEPLKRKRFTTRKHRTDVDHDNIDYSDDSSLSDDHQVNGKLSSKNESTLPPIHIIGDGVGVVPLSDEEAKAPLDIPKVYVGEENEYYATYSVNQAASKLNVEQSVVKRWINSGKLVGLVNKKGELRVPKAQIRDGRIAPYLDKLRHIFEKPADLWQYLVTEKLVQNEPIRPLDVHFQQNLRKALDLSVSLRMDFT